MNITGIILAGGKSSRMGSDKGLLAVNGVPMISHVINSMKKAGIKDIIIISNNSDYQKFGFPVFPDIIEDKGPLGGIFTGLSKSKTSKNVILSCDIPYIDETIIDCLIRESGEEQVSIVKFQNQLHPLIGMYDSSLLKALGEHLILNMLKVEQFINGCDFKILDIEKLLPQIKNKSFANINTPEELRKSEL